MPQIATVGICALVGPAAPRAEKRGGHVTRRRLARLRWFLRPQIQCPSSLNCAPQEVAAGISALAGLPRLRHLEVCALKMLPANLCTLSGLARLTELSVSGAHVDGALPEAPAAAGQGARRRR